VEKPRRAIPVGSGTSKFINRSFSLLAEQGDLALRQMKREKRR